MNILNFFNSLSNSDVVFYGLIILLSIISVILFYLIYTQNKEMSKKMMEKSVFSENDKVIVKRDEDNSHPITINEIENLDNKEELIEVSDLSIPDPLELTKSLQINDSIEDLQSLTRELEAIPRERTIKMTPYETEQEETAIISYDELVKQNDKKSEIGYIPVDEVDVAVAQMDDNLEVPIVEEVIVPEEMVVEDVVDTIYSHEEHFLNSLKILQKSMREND